MFYGISIGSLLFLSWAISNCINLYEQLRKNGWNKSAYALIPVIIITAFMAAVFVFGILSMPLISLIFQWVLNIFNTVTCWTTHDNLFWKTYHLFIIGLLSCFTIFYSPENLMAFGGGTGSVFAALLVLLLVYKIYELEVKLQKSDANRLILQRLERSSKEFKNIDQALLDEQTKCAICLDGFQVRDKVNQLPCHHIFHKDCIHPWVEVKMEDDEESTCPTCRKPLP
jgi:hypothetical protein